MKRQKLTVIFALAAALLLLPSIGRTATITDVLNVSATVVNNARITSVGAISFGNYDPTSATATDANGSVALRATKAMAYTIYISADRSMTNGSDTLNYELYTDSTRLTPWGSTLSTGVPYTSLGNAASTKTIYGRIPALQDVGAGSYTDTVTITVEF